MARYRIAKRGTSWAFQVSGGYWWKVGTFEMAVFLVWHSLRVERELADPSWDY